MKIEIETPVMKLEGYPSEMHRLGVVIALDGQRAQVQWMVREFLPEPKYGARVKVKTWCKIESLKVWPESLRVRLCDEHVTLCADGMEYTTPRA